MCARARAGDERARGMRGWTGRLATVVVVMVEGAWKTDVNGEVGESARGLRSERRWDGTSAQGPGPRTAPPWRGRFKLAGAQKPHHHQRRPVAREQNTTK